VHFREERLTVDPKASKEKQLEQRNWRYSIAVFAQKAQQFKVEYDKLKAMVDK
jgi:hypothetical protein